MAHERCPLSGPRSRPRARGTDEKTRCPLSGRSFGEASHETLRGRLSGRLSGHDSGGLSGRLSGHAFLSSVRLVRRPLSGHAFGSPLWGRLSSLVLLAPRSLSAPFEAASAVPFSCASCGHLGGCRLVAGRGHQATRRADRAPPPKKWLCAHTVSHVCGMYGASVTASASL